MTPDHTAGVFCTGGTWTQRQTHPKGRWHEDTGRQGHLQPARPARRSDRFQPRGPEEGPALQAPQSQTLPPGRERMHFCRPAPLCGAWSRRPQVGAAGPARGVPSFCQWQEPTADPRGQERRPSSLGEAPGHIPAYRDPSQHRPSTGPVTVWGPTQVTSREGTRCSP